MTHIRDIVVLHTAAIGDAVLATPVSASLKLSYPQSTITYLTHPQLIGLLSLCPYIDEFVSIGASESLTTVRNHISSARPDLVVDLSGSLKSFLRTSLTAPRVVRYRKEPGGSPSCKHAADNFLETLRPLAAQRPKNLFPTLFPDTQLLDRVTALLPAGAKLIALVPGVGGLRPHRAWDEQAWIELSERIVRDTSFSVLLIGGEEERRLCEKIEVSAGGRCLNLAGRLSLPETAAALKLCLAAVSGDTGPAHIAVAVGTPVIGLYGPTLLERSGPYGNRENCISVSHLCRCIHSKECLIDSSAKRCMTGITATQVMDTLERALLSIS